MPLMDRTVDSMAGKVQRKWGNVAKDHRHGFKSTATAEDSASVHGVNALPTEPPVHSLSFFSIYMPVLKSF